MNNYTEQNWSRNSPRIHNLFNSHTVRYNLIVNGEVLQVEIWIDFDINIILCFPKKVNSNFLWKKLEISFLWKALV